MLDEEDHWLYMLFKSGNRSLGLIGDNHDRRFRARSWKVSRLFYFG